MPYSEFTLAKAKKYFDLTTSEDTDIFAAVPELECSEYLAETLRYNVPLALASNSEKARSEMIIAPILIEVRKQLQSQFSLFSGIDFNVDASQSLTGFCDFIISTGSERLFVSAPVMMLVEAKKEDIIAGLGQCVAEMVAAQIFNEREGNEVSVIYGAVTSGTNWKFLKLAGKVVEIDLVEYYLTDVNKILGILASGVRES
ncbi:MAG TPA: hypothetical protein DCL61_08780 [Cyanobacteria bacterium UBA12227]|nr:hypothetical protein [Cyanobacteria bacterium UBA12227]HAX85966.1 hypothetical protein [Cyanobacteria bacterium UBA11370]HBY76086.1 hypothetical protein [Cyanobacteria bacterium UBA11148]